MVWAKLKGFILDLLFPPRCVGCGKSGWWMCESCIETVNFIEGRQCRFCGRILKTGSICALCAGSKHAIDRIISVTYFDGLIQEAIHRLKYAHCVALAAPLAGLMAEYWSRDPLPADFIVPVPLHPRRFQERGYNQAALLAEELGKALGIPVLINGLVRVRYTKPQVGLDAEERKRNVEGAFLCADPALIGKSVMVVDDVCTTGATLEACGAALKEAGAKHVYGFTLARAP